MALIGFGGITEYMCTYCGKKIKRSKGEGRPDPGYCLRKPKDKDGKMKPHTWRINKRFK